MNDGTDEGPLIDVHGMELDSLLAPEAASVLATALDQLIAADNNSNNQAFTNSIG